MRKYLLIMLGIMVLISMAGCSKKIKGEAYGEKYVLTPADPFKDFEKGDIHINIYNDEKIDEYGRLAVDFYPIKKEIIFNEPSRPGDQAVNLSYTEGTATIKYESIKKDEKKKTISFYRKDNTFFFTIEFLEKDRIMIESYSDIFCDIKGAEKLDISPELRGELIKENKNTFFDMINGSYTDKKMVYNIRTPYIYKQINKKRLER